MAERSTFTVPASRLGAGELYVRPSAVRPLSTARARAALDFHRRIPGYRPTPLRRAGSTERRLGLERVWVKDESERLGLPAFKMLGVSWALFRTLAERLGSTPEGWRDIGDLAESFASLRPLTLVCATDGNHGRAVARMARLFGFDARIFVPSNTVESRIRAITSEGATVEIVEGTYDETVARAAAEATDPGVLLVSDTSWPGYEEFPQRVVEGYSTIFAEVEADLDRAGEGRPDIVVVQIGVGALAAAAARWYCARDHGVARVIGVEPARAACVLESLRAGRIVQVDGGQDSIMAGLNCGTPSLVAWPLLEQSLAACVAIGDERARDAVRLLAADGIESGESGAAGIGGLLEIAEGAPVAARELGLDRDARVLVFSTEGPTDPGAWERIVGRPPARMPS